MRHSIHKVFINLTSYTFFCAVIIDYFSAAFIYRCFFVNCVSKQFFRFVYTVGNFCLNDFFTVESSHFNFSVCRNDNTFSMFYFIFCKFIFNSARTVCFDFEFNTHFFCFFLHNFRSHVSMGDSRWAGCNCKDVKVSVIFLVGFCFFLSLFFFEFFFFCFIYHR